MSKHLQLKNTIYLLIWLPIVLLAGSLLFYFLMKRQAHHMQEKQLKAKQHNVWRAFTAAPANTALSIPGEYQIIPGTPLPSALLNKTRDTVLFDSSENRSAPFAILTGQFTLHNRSYQLSTYVSSVEISHLIIAVFAILIFIFLLLLMAIVIINRKLSHSLWRPFYTTMDQLHQYDITQQPNPNLPENADIREFNQLNKALNALIKRANLAYFNQKQFVENAAHEIQTPLAIIRSKLELMINQPGLTAKSAALLEDLTSANNRLSQLNRNLLLLTRIDNNQFPEKEQVQLSALLERLLNGFQAYYEEPLPDILPDIAPRVQLYANAALLEVLFNNLLKNAIVHNNPSGFIKIQLTPERLMIENSGPPVEGDPSLLFERFRKGNPASRTTGLGLALVQQICRLYGFGLQYTYHTGIHQVSVTFC
jgi:signal transduction histidine kinase